MLDRPTDCVVSVSITLTAVLPAEYPDELPELSVEAVKGLTESQVTKLSEIASKAVRSFVDAGFCFMVHLVLQAVESKGEVMIWSISEKLKEWLVENNKPEVGAHESMMDKLNKEATEEDEKRAEVCWLALRGLSKQRLSMPKPVCACRRSVARLSEPSVAPNGRHWASSPAHSSPPNPLRPGARCLRSLRPRSRRPRLPSSPPPSRRRTKKRR